MKQLHAVFINCTLKRSPAVSNTEALSTKVIEWFDLLDVTSELIRVADYNVLSGVSSDEGEGDEWPLILDRIRQADILVVATPIWFGLRSSIAQLVMERLDGTYAERNEYGQFPLYNKVAGVVITGNEDGAHAAAESTLFNLTHLGCAIPPNADTYWVGDAGPGPSYIEAGQDHPYTKRTTKWMATNLVKLARMLKADPFTDPVPAVDGDYSQDAAASTTNDNLLDS